MNNIPVLPPRPAVNPTGSGAALTALNPSNLATGSGAVNIVAGGSNQNVTASPSGSGDFVSSSAVVATNGYIKSANNVTLNLYGGGGGSIGFHPAATSCWSMNGTTFSGRSDGTIGLASGSTPGTNDAAISRIAAGHLAVGNGTAGNASGSLSLANLTASGAIIFGTFTVATVPSAATYARGNIYVSDEAGGAVPAFSDGTNWRRYTDRAIIS